MELNLMNIDITLAFTAEDLAWMQRLSTSVPPFWTGHAIAPSVHDVLRIGDRQFVVVGRAWEHTGTRPVLRLYLSPGTAAQEESLH